MTTPRKPEPRPLSESLSLTIEDPVEIAIIRAHRIGVRSLVRGLAEFWLPESRRALLDAMDRLVPEVPE